MNKQLPTLKLFLTLISITFFSLPMIAQSNAWINEIHYDNASTDAGEAVEVIIENPATLSDYMVELYNGSNGTVYDSETLDNFIVGTTDGNFTIYYWQPSSIQNGDPDGMALSYDGSLIQFLSYEGTFTATDGNASGITSTAIGVSESSSTQIGESLQLTGSGDQYSDFAWAAASSDNFGSLNNGQSFPVVNPNDNTSTVNAPSTQVAGTTVNANNINTQANAVDVFSFEIEDAGSGDGLPTNVISMRFSPGANNTLLWGDDLQGIRLYNGTSYLSPSNTTITSTEIILDFSTPIVISDGSSQEYTLSFYINATEISDNDAIQVEIEDSGHDFEANLSGSAFEDPLINGTITGNIITVNVEATQLSYLQQPTDTNVDEIMSPNVQVAFTDDNGNVDSTYTGSTGTVNITTNGSLDASATNSVQALNGIATFDNLVFDSPQSSVTLTASHGEAVISGTYDSDSFEVLQEPEDIAVQDFDNTQPEWGYLPDIPVFDSGSGYYGPSNNYSPLDNPNFSGNIFFENDLQDNNGNGTSGFANLNFSTIDLENHNNVVLTFDYDVEGYNANNDDAKYELFYDGTGQGEVFLLDGNGTAEDAEGTVTVNIPDTVEEVYLVVSIRNNGTDGYSGFDNFKLEGVPDVPQSFVYNNGWTPQNPEGGISGSNDDVTIENGTVVFNQEIIANNFTVDAGAHVEIVDLLEINGDLTNNGTLIFTSTTETQTGILGEVPATSTITGEVTVERYIPANRAFRFFSSPVTTSTTINDNWQEGGNNTGTNFPTDNENPNPGYGIHITGSPTGANGFDATPSGNPSLFSFDNITQTWEEVNNTNSNILEAGEPYRVFVRGDRSINVTDNDATPTETVIRATGMLETGTVTYTDMSDFSGDFNFIGNPYQAPVDMVAVLNNSTNISTNGYYTWESDLSTQGAYVYIEDDGTVTPSGSNANTYLQPGQAAFTVTENNASGTSVIFEESYKATTSELTEVFRPANNSIQIVGNLYTTSRFNNGGSAVDGFRVKFSDNFTNAVDLNDGTKPFNIDENMGIMNGSDMFIVEERELPTNNEQIQLFNNNYRSENYVLSLEVADFGNLIPYLYDNYTGEYTELNEGENAITFSVNENNESSNTDRFSIVFSTDALKVKNLENHSLVIYPNPLNDGALQIEFANSKGYDKVTISAYNVLGKRVYHTEKQNVTSSLEINEANNWQSGVYIIKMNDGTNTITKKIIKN